MRRPAFLFCFLSVLGVLGAAAAEPATPESRLREQLRSTALQLRASENERATLQAAQAASEERIKALTEQVEALTKRVVEDKKAGDQAVAELKARLVDRDGEFAKAKQEIARLESALAESVKLAATKEGLRAKSAGEAVVLQRKVAEQKTRNANLYRLGLEVLARYEKFGLGDALTAREPFVGITRVKFENLIQDFSDKLADERIKQP